MKQIQGYGVGLHSRKDGWMDESSTVSFLQQWTNSDSTSGKFTVHENNTKLSLNLFLLIDISVKP